MSIESPTQLVLKGRYLIKSFKTDSILEVICLEITELCYKLLNKNTDEYLWISKSTLQSDMYAEHAQYQLIEILPVPLPTGH